MARRSRVTLRFIAIAAVLAGRPHLPAAIRSYMGDSRGRWEGDTLVVATPTSMGSPRALTRGRRWS